MEARREDLLPVPYYHVVFTLPEAINKVALYQPATVYGLLFSTAWNTIQSFAADVKYLGAQAGMISVLHTWGQTLSLHPHLHCIIPGGGITKGGRWKCTRSNGKYLYPVKALSKVFRAKYVSSLRQALPNESKTFFQSLFNSNWVVYAKRPFGGPEQVVEYLGRYTHKIAINNHRITGIDDDTVSFMYKDYRQEGIKKQMTLHSIEFIRRFALHILPKGFVRIRHYGMLSNAIKVSAIAIIRKELTPGYKQEQVASQTLIANTTATSRCPCCKKGTMQIVMGFDHRGPPVDLMRLLLRQETPAT
jgi:hypothetical protein